MIGSGIYLCSAIFVAWCMYFSGGKKRKTVFTSLEFIPVCFEGLLPHKLQISEEHFEKRDVRLICKTSFILVKMYNKTIPYFCVTERNDFGKIHNKIIYKIK